MPLSSDDLSIIVLILFSVLVFGPNQLLAGEQLAGISHLMTVTTNALTFLKGEAEQTENENSVKATQKTRGQAAFYQQLPLFHFFNLTGELVVDKTCSKIVYCSLLCLTLSSR
jgi:hypothetical protein